MKNKVLLRRKRVQKRVRSSMIRVAAFPRLSVHRTNKHIYAQVIDDYKMHTLVSATDATIKQAKLSSTQKAQQVGTDIAAAMKKHKIPQVVFDRGAYPYKGRIKALAEAVREAGITI